MLLLPSEPPRNAEFMVAAYSLVAVVLLVYGGVLVARARRLLKEMEQQA